MRYYSIKFWQRLTGQVCKCNHTKMEHIKSADTFDQMRKWDQHCMGWIYEGKIDGSGTLHCCQCLYYEKKDLYDSEFYQRVIAPFLRALVMWIKREKPEPFDPNKMFCLCGHSFPQHTGPILPEGETIYHSCGQSGCNCKAYYYEGSLKNGKTHS